MKIEEQVCNLELAKKMRENKVPQRSLWYWEEMPNGGKLFLAEHNQINMYPHYSAFTVAELGEMLPPTIKYDGKEDFFCFHRNEEWNLMYHKRSVSDVNEANARAKMLIMLLEEGIIKAEELEI